MRNLVVCCDGTWNTPDQKHDGVPVPTNVVRLYNSIATMGEGGAPQIKYYHNGVGTEGNWWERAVGGSVGGGLGKNIQSAYKWLGVNYQPGDRIFLFGFSRGAYTVRSLSGLIGFCGLLDLSQVPEEEVWARVGAAYRRGYRKRQECSKWAGDWEFHSGTGGGDLKISFLGVWDTIGALGVPDDLALLNLIDDPEKYAFHDTELSDSVEHARHAVALDEMRASFVPTLWTGIEGGRDVKQVWFPGVHCDVGGGYPEKGLSDGALLWMMKEAEEKGLAFNPEIKKQVAPDARDVLHDSCTGVFKKLRTQPRSVPRIRSGDPSLHLSVSERQSVPPITQAPYRETITLAHDSERELPIFAMQHWNDIGLYLEKGATYQFTASGQWLDRNISCGPEGTDDGNFQLGELVQLAGSLWGKMESLFQITFKNRTADFYGTRRLEEYPWFCLVGAVANGGNPGIDGTPAPHEFFKIGKECTYTANSSGYLYCFANDAWHFYENNRGSVMLKVKRTD